MSNWKEVQASNAQRLTRLRAQGVSIADLGDIWIQQMLTTVLDHFDLLDDAHEQHEDNLAKRLTQIEITVRQQKLQQGVNHSLGPVAKLFLPDNDPRKN